MDCATKIIPNPLFQPEEVSFAQKFQAESLCHQLSSDLQLMLMLVERTRDRTIPPGWDYGQTTPPGRLGPTIQTWAIRQTTGHQKKLPKSHTGPAHFVGYLISHTSWTMGTFDRTWPMMVSALGQMLVMTSTTIFTTFLTQTQVCYRRYLESMT